MGNVVNGGVRAAPSVRRWRSAGADRLYVNSGDGSRIGWVDLTSGERMLEEPAHAELFERLVAEWMNRTPG
ncbi:MAG: hypothetical protein ABSH30_01450 [Acidimicrobiales bacterium]